MLTKKQFKALNSFLLFRSMGEVMLDLYGNIKGLPNFFDPIILQKWKNLLPSLEKGSKEIHNQLSEEDIKIFYDFTNAIEYLAKLTEDPDKLYEITSLINSHQKGDITIINTREELLQVVNGEEVSNG